MAGPWDAPPTEEEMAVARNRAFSSPPTDQEVAAARPRVPDAPKVGPVETYLRRTWDTLPGARPFWNAAGAAAKKAALEYYSSDVRLSDGVKSEMRAAGMPDPDQEPGFVETYRETRDDNLRRMDAGSEQNPWSGRLGTATGIGMMLAAPLPKFVPPAGSSALARVGAASATGGGYGMFYGATHGPADLTKGEVGQFSRDVLGVDGLVRAKEELDKGNKFRSLLEFAGAGGAGGAGVGALLAGVAEIARPAAGLIKRSAVGTGRRVLQGGSDLSSATKKPLSDKAVEAALEEGAIQPLGNTAGAANKLEKITDKTGAEYRALIAELEKRGVAGADAKTLAEKLRARRAEVEPDTMSDAVPKVYEDAATKVAAKAPQRPSLPPFFKEELRGALPGTEPGSLPLSRGLKLTRSSQEEARRAYRALQDTELGDAQMDVARFLRLANEESVAQAGRLAGPGSETAALADKFVPIKRKLGPLIEASEAAERGASKAAQRSAGPGLRATMMGASTGSPLTGIPAAMATEMVAGRLPSTYASGAYRLARALETGAAGSRAAIGAEEAMSPGARPGGILASRGLAQAYLELLNTNPKAVGKYGPVIASERTPDDRLAMTYALVQNDPEFAQLLETLARQMNGGR